MRSIFGTISRDCQAVLVVEENQNVDLQELKCWSKAEGKEREYAVFEKKLN